MQSNELCGIEIFALPANAEMQMRTVGAAGGAAECDELAAGDMLAFFHPELRKMHVDGGEAEAMIDDNAVSLEVERAGEDNASGVDGMDGSALAGAVIEATMNAGE